MKNYKVSKKDPITYPQKCFLIELGFDARDLDYEEFSKYDAHCLIRQALKEKEELRKIISR